jgi:hypothetical protein
MADSLDTVDLDCATNIGINGRYFTFSAIVGDAEQKTQVTFS